MPKLVGRKKEIALLEEALHSNHAEFIALYGRRRIGKTFLIRQFFSDKDVVFLNTTGAQKAPSKEQIGHFSKQISTVFYNNAPLATKKNWDETFALLTTAMNTVAPDKKIVLFFDEFPWMATQNSRLLENLDYYWNQYWSNDLRVKLIICGSSTSWIIKKIINNRGGLHNRITHKIRLQPFTLNESKAFLKNKGIKLNHSQILQLYMVMGGVPYYLAQISKGLSASQVITKLAFSKDSFLLNEFDNLFSSLFSDYHTYIEILRLISKKRQGIGKTELLNALDKSQNGAQGLQKLFELEESGFIQSFTPHFHKTRGIFYRLIDEYTDFYLTWLEPLKKTLNKSSLIHQSWNELQLTPKWNSWLGYAFESICYKHLAQIMEKLAISPASIANSWRYVPKNKADEEGAQIDLLFDRFDDTITICEIKYSDKSFVIDKNYAKNLRHKCDTFSKVTRTKKQFFIIMIAAHGVKENTYYDDLISQVVTLDDLFKT